MRQAHDALSRILAALGSVVGREFLDIGCGHGRLAASLAAAGARVTAVDTDRRALAAARRAAPEARVERAAAEALPFDDASFDGVVMLNSLHHVPRAALFSALAGMARVAKPGAPIVVVEPLAEGAFFEAMRPVEDETAVRAAAQAAITDACAEGGPLRLVETQEFERVDTFWDADQFMARLAAADPARKAALSGARGAVERLFGALAEPGPNGFSLRQPHRMHRLRKA